MAIGQITKFPIETKFEFATSGQFGICPQLCAYIHDVELECDPNVPVSEHGISLAIDGLKNGNVYFKNIGTGYGIWDSINSQGLNLHNVLVGNETTIVGNEQMTENTSLQITLNSEHEVIFNGLELGEDGPIDPSTLDFCKNANSVQGGKYQYVSEIDSFNTSGMIIAHAAVDNVIGKIFIKSIDRFITDTQFSIGVSGDQEKYIKKFQAPTISNLHLNHEVIKYNDGLLDKEYDWIATGDIQDIKLFYYGETPTSGKLKFNVFYDKINWAPDFGYVYYGTSLRYDEELGEDILGTDLSRYNMNDDTVSIRRQSFIATKGYFNVIANSFWSYIAGGWDYPGLSNKIFKADTKNDVVSEVNRGTLSSPKHSCYSAKNGVRRKRIPAVLQRPGSNMGII